MHRNPATRVRPGDARWRLVLAAAGIVAFGTACADSVTYCVSTATQLQAALSSSSDNGLNNGKDALIHIVKGTYVVGLATLGQSFGYQSTAATGSLTLEGGYDAGCGTRTLDALATVIDGNNLSQVLVIENVNNEVDVSNLTFQNGNATGFGAGLQVNFAPADVATVKIFDNVIRNNHTSEFAGGLATATSSSAHFVLVYSNLITGNSAASGIGGAYILADGGEGVFYDDTVSGNSTTAMNGVGGAECNGTGTCEVFNSIFWGNTNWGLRLETPGAYLISNDIDTRDGSSLLLENVGNLSVLPRFVDSANGDFRLDTGSPLFAVSSHLDHGIDIEGYAYALRGVQDMGVYAQTIYSNGFDTLPPQ